jgi:glycosyltransferase 2 family protein
VVLLLLPGAEIFGALVVFRFVYFLVPLAIGGTTFLVSEAVWRTRIRSRG